ncbi:MAG TPA: 3'(2'),5'-bisphosphate nucleotidase CysQ [Candidatus Tectomicrobia bacterium]|jgi:myo-inositol-1(or 4)-monophosphatase
MDRVILAHALEVATQAARQAGQVILSYYRSSYEVQHKSPDNPVTTADLAANDVLQQTLLEVFPEAGWLSEESADNPERLQRDMVWVIDPIDGTKEFIRGIDEFVVVVALVVKHQVALAVTYNPARQELVHACRGQGAFCNGYPVRVSNTSHIQQAVVLASRSETGRGEFERFKTLLTVQPLGSVAYKLARVAQGQGDMTFSLVPKHEWDICAGTLLVTEAGGRVSDPQGRPLLFNQPDPLRTGVVATNGLLYDQVLQLIQQSAVA